MTEQTAPAFDLTGRLPLGETALVEASAGTGKTYTLAALAVRYVAEHGLRIDQLLLVTFTRSAAAELRARIREGLVRAADHLDGPRPAVDSDDPVLAHLAAGTDAERRERHDRLAGAVADFDTATITTIHGFCAQVRSTMGVLIRSDGDADAVTSEGRLIAQASADRYFEGLSGEVLNPFGSRKLDALIDVVKKARTLTDSTVEATSRDPGDVRFAELVGQVSTEVDERLRREGGVSYDSLLVSVRDALKDHPGLAASVRDQFQVAMIDEFQDTDPVQWAIFQTLFAPDNVPRRPTLILVGDPKQAIYSFRGGDVYTYLDAQSDAAVQVLAFNQRSDTAVVEAMNALGTGQVYGEKKIAYIPVEVAERNRHRRVVLPDGSTGAGLAVRALTVDPKEFDSASTKRLIGRDLASVAHELLTGVRIPGDPDDPADRCDADGLRSVRPKDLAILVGSTADARPMVDALRSAGIPYVLRLRDDVGDSPAADQWRTLLHALDRPASTMRVTAAALTWFVGWSPEEVAAALDAPAEDDAAARRLVELQHELAGWAESLASDGIPALFGRARRSHAMVKRLLTGPDGERRLTDLEHLAELIHTEAGVRGRGLTAGSAIAILDSLGGTPDDEIAADAAQRRIDSDADAVQIMTIHGSKGLEFPFVLLPTLWSGGQRVQARAPFAYYDDSRRRRIIDVSTRREFIDEKTGRPKAVEQASKAVPEVADEAKRQNCGDQHRLTYVALTRSRHQTVAWWYSDSHSGSKPTGLARLLFGPPDGEAHTPVDLPKDPAEVVAAIRARVAETRAGGSVAVHEVAGARDPATLDVLDLVETRTKPESVSRLEKTLERSGRVWSFTSLAGGIGGHGGGQVEHVDPTDDGAADRGAADEADDGKEIDDEFSGERSADLVPAAAPDPDVSLASGWSRVSPFDGLGGGKGFGNLVHHLFEKVDLDASEPEAEFALLLDQPAGFAVTDEQRASLPGALAGVMRTPLGPGFGGVRLADLCRADHLDELGFHLPVATDHPVSAGRIGSVIADHLPTDDPLRSWAIGLAGDLGSVRLQGFLKGSIDLTLRYLLDGSVRYSVVDYKTNNLGPSNGVGALEHYRQRSMAQVMASSNYALQAVLYTVALHRYLRWRVSGYAPDTHLGPVGYLFVRAMVGPDTPVEEGVPAGVFTWHLPPGLVTAVSDLFAGAPPTGGAS